MDILEYVFFKAIQAPCIKFQSVNQCFVLVIPNFTKVILMTNTYTLKHYYLSYKDRNFKKKKIL
jgi:hypothetical protein